MTFSPFQEKKLEVQYLLHYQEGQIEKTEQFKKFIKQIFLLLKIRPRSSTLNNSVVQYLLHN